MIFRGRKELFSKTDAFVHQGLRGWWVRDIVEDSSKDIIEYRSYRTIAN
jgi:hypothetical protein